MRLHTTLLVASALLLLAGPLALNPAHAQRAATAKPIAIAKPEDVGFSAERLKRITAALEAEIKAGTLPGALVLIGRKGRIAHFEGVGELDPEAKKPMSKDGIFRI